MIQGQNIICFSNDWDSDPLSKKHIMTRLAKHNRVLWVNSIGNRRPTATVSDAKRILKKLYAFTKGSQVADYASNIHVLSPIAIPFHGNAMARWVNRRVLTWTLRRACRRLGFKNPITWTFEPASGDVAGSLRERALVYHCVDEFSEFTGADKQALLDLEERLIRKSQCVIVSSDRLLHSKRRYNQRTYLVTHGVDVTHFRQACDPDTLVPAEMRQFKGPVIGFFGLIADWVDLDLIRFIADSRPDWNVVLIGKPTTDLRIFDGLTNIHLTGSRPYASLPAYAKAFNVALLPFAINELTLAANPLKLREYLAAGLPVVSTALPEAEKLRHLVRIGRDRLEILDHLQSVVDSGRTGPQMDISLQMDGESWDEKVEELSRIVMGGIETAEAA